jgi:hypothetical protein
MNPPQNAHWDTTMGLGLIVWDDQQQRWRCPNQERVKEMIRAWHCMDAPSIAYFIADRYLEPKPKGWLS